MIIKDWNEPLWRVDDKKGRRGNTLKTIYPDDRPTYFLIDPSANASYIKHYVRKNTSGRQKLYYYTKQFIPIQTLKLLDMNHIETIEDLLSDLTEGEANAIKTSFKIQDGIVHRSSENNAKYIDDQSLAAICRYCNIHSLDGYFINAPGLHAEVGLCSSAFTKLIFDDQIEKMEVAGVNRSRKRARSKSNNGGRSRKRRKINSNSNSNSSSNNNSELIPPPKILRYNV